MIGRLPDTTTFGQEIILRGEKNKRKRLSLKVSTGQKKVEIAPLKNTKTVKFLTDSRW